MPSPTGGEAAALRESNAGTYSHCIEPWHDGRCAWFRVSGSTEAQRTERGDMDFRGATPAVALCERR